MSCKVHPLFVCNSFPNSTIFEPWSISRAAWSFKVNKIMLLLPTTFFTGSLEPSGQLVPCLPWRYLGSLRSALCWPPISPSLLVTVMYSAINHVYNFSISPNLSLNLLYLLLLSSSLSTPVTTSPSIALLWLALFILEFSAQASSLPETSWDRGPYLIGS